MFGRKKQPQLPARNVKSRTTQTQVFSYYSNRSSSSTPTGTGQTARTRLDSISLANVQRSFWVRYLPSLASLAAVVAVLAYTTTLTAQPRVALASVNGQLSVVRDDAVYDLAAKEIMADTIMNRSKLTINSDSVADKFGERFPELSDVVVTIPLFGRESVIEARPTQPTMILTSNNGSYVIDNQGRPVLSAKDLASSLRDKLPTVHDQTSTEVKLGDYLLTTELVDFIAGLHYQLAASKTEVESYTLPTLANEIHLRVKGQGYYVKFNTENDVRQQVGTYLAVVNRLAAEGQAANEYIDVRVAERAYIK